MSSPELHSPITPDERRYFQHLENDQINTAKICFKTLLQHLNLATSDSIQTLRQIHRNFSKWDQTVLGKKAWEPLLNELSDFVKDPQNPQPLINRVTILEGYLG